MIAKAAEPSGAVPGHPELPAVGSEDQNLLFLLMQMN